MPPRVTLQRLDSLKHPDEYDDEKTPAQIQDAEADSETYADVFNYMISQLRQVLGTSDWKDPVPASLQDLASNLNLRWLEDSFIATLGQTVFTLSGPAADDPSFFLFVNGVEYTRNVDFTVVGDIVTWLDVPFTLTPECEIYCKYTAPGGTPATAEGRSGWVKIVDVAVVGGEASGKIYQDTDNTVLQSAIVSGASLLLHLKASYPLVKIGAVTHQLDLVSDGGHYEDDSVPVTIPDSGPLRVTVQTPDNEDGAYDTAVFTISLPPVITVLSFTGGYPGSQWEVKEDDGFDVAIVADKEFDRIRVLDYEACKLEEFPVASTLSTTVRSTIDDEGDAAVARPARVQVRDALTGAWSSTRDTNALGGTVDGVDLVTCNNLHPSVGWSAPSYPGAQQALKNSEQATLTLTASDYDTIPVDSPNGQLTIVDGTPPGITVERFAGDYNVSTNNLRATASRAANDATTVAQIVVKIAHVPAGLDAAFASRLRSGGNDGTSAQNHSISVTADQQLASFDMDEDAGGGTFLGSWSGGPTVWTRDLQVHDDDTKGSYSWQNVAAVNLAGIVTTSLDTGASYELGGFVARTVVWQAYQTVSDSVNVAISDYSKVEAGLWQATDEQSVRKAIGSTPSYDPSMDNAYCASATGTSPHTLIWLDLDQAETNTGTAHLYDYEETV